MVEVYFHCQVALNSFDSFFDILSEFIFAKIEILIMNNLYTQMLWNKGFYKFIPTTYLIFINISHIISRSREAILFLFFCMRYTLKWQKLNSRQFQRYN